MTVGMFDIQRVPQGLQNVLALVGPGTPPQLQQYLQGTMDMLQLYGLSQRTVVGAVNAAVAINVATDVVVPTWSVLFNASFTVAKTATQTALAASIRIQRGNIGIPVAFRELGPFGATTAGFGIVTYNAPYPLVLPAGSIIRGVVDVLGTDATANVNIQGEIGVFG